MSERHWLGPRRRGARRQEQARRGFLSEGRFSADDWRAFVIPGATAAVADMAASSAPRFIPTVNPGIKYDRLLRSYVAQLGKPAIRRGLVVPALPAPAVDAIVKSARNAAAGFRAGVPISSLVAMIGLGMLAQGLNRQMAGEGGGAYVPGSGGWTWPAPELYGPGSFIDICNATISDGPYGGASICGAIGNTDPDNAPDWALGSGGAGWDNVSWRLVERFNPGFMPSTPAVRGEYWFNQPFPFSEPEPGYDDLPLPRYQPGRIDLPATEEGYPWSDPAMSPVSSPQRLDRPMPYRMLPWRLNINPALSPTEQSTRSNGEPGQKPAGTGGSYISNRWDNRSRKWRPALHRRARWRPLPGRLWLGPEAG